MSTEPYPEVSGDESGIVPPQSSIRTSEWPKRLRTLTAAELDRLTIDEAGRFYWDGKLVDYDTGTRQPAAQPPDPIDRSMDALDRATYELLGSKSLTTIDGELAPVAPSVVPEPPVIDREMIRTEVFAAMSGFNPLAPQVDHDIEQTGLKLSALQTVGALIILLSVIVGAIGMATYGYVAASEWGCKTGTFKNGCPLPPPAPHRPDIPA